MKIYLLESTPMAKQLLVFSKRTRHMKDVSAWDKVLEMSEEELDGELGYVFSTIGSSWEFVSYTFLLCDVTRAFTHQLVRHRVGVAFAQQAQRVAVMEKFGYEATGSVLHDSDRKLVYDHTMTYIQQGYDALIKMGANPQDARGILPTNVHTNILFKINLRALSDVCAVRLCIRAQGEFQKAVRGMQRLVLEEHPWAAPVLAPHCIQHSQCKWPRYRECPIRQKHPELNPLPAEKIEEIRKDWKNISGYDPQPKVTDWKPISQEEEKDGE